MKKRIKNAISIIMTAAMIITLLPSVALTAKAAGTALPICVELDNFNSNNVSSSLTAQTLLYALGNAAVSGNVLRIVPASGNQKGTVVRRNKITLQGGFSTYFKMCLNGGSRADGLTFVIQNNDTPQIGAYGGGIGYKGIPNSFGVEFDIYQNNADEGISDPNNSHVAIVKNGSNDHSSNNANVVDYTSTAAQAIYGNVINVWVDYASNGTLTVTYGTSETRSDSANHTISDNVGTALVGKDVYVGFAASTGGSTANHDVKKWYFKDSYVEGGLSTAAGTYTQGATSIDITMTPSDNPTSVKVIEYNGSTAMSGSVDIYIDGTLKETVAADGANGATYDFGPLTGGSHTIKAVSQDGGTSVSKVIETLVAPQLTTGAASGIETKKATLNGNISDKRRSNSNKLWLLV